MDLNAFVKKVSGYRICEISRLKSLLQGVDPFMLHRLYHCQRSHWRSCCPYQLQRRKNKQKTPQSQQRSTLPDSTLQWFEWDSGKEESYAPAAQGSSVPAQSDQKYSCRCQSPWCHASPATLQLAQWHPAHPHRRREMQHDPDTVAASPSGPKQHLPGSTSAFPAPFATPPPWCHSQAPNGLPLVF